MRRDPKTVDSHYGAPPYLELSTSSTISTGRGGLGNRQKRSD